MNSKLFINLNSKLPLIKNLSKSRKKLFILLIHNLSDLVLGLDMIVRDENGNTLDVNSLSTTQLYNQHVKASQRIEAKIPVI